MLEKKARKLVRFLSNLFMLKRSFQKANIGYCFTIPKEIPGSAQYYKNQFEKAMAIINEVS